MPGAKKCPRCKRMVAAESLAVIEYVENSRRIRMCLDCAWKVYLDNGACPPNWLAPTLFDNQQQKGN